MQNKIIDLIASFILLYLGATIIRAIYDIGFIDGKSHALEKWTIQEGNVIQLPSRKIGRKEQKTSDCDNAEKSGPVEKGEEVNESDGKLH